MAFRFLTHIVDVPRQLVPTSKRLTRLSLIALLGWLTIQNGILPAPTSLRAEDVSPTAEQTPSIAASVEEARIRARLLYRSLDGALQVMHRDLFDDEKSLRIPSRSLEDVFEVLEEKEQVKLRWIAVNAKPMSSESSPADDFEKEAAKVITSGKADYELAQDGVYRFAGMIRLSGQCLKCHVPMRKSLEDRFSALVIQMPYETEKPTQER